ncbi:MAG: NADP-dependent malic enzyme [Planctomycetota bacterium]
MATIDPREALDYHSQGRPGKTAIRSTKPCITQHDLSLAYTPGVAAPCREIGADPSKVYAYTNKGNLVAVVTNGSAVLGLGSLGPMAAKPVMEGKAVLFKRFADIDVFDIEIDAKDPMDAVRAIKAIAPTFGGINLEDFKAPECFVVEEELSKTLDIPVFHDDQHGTAIICCAAMLNACELTKKKLSDIRIVVNGTGAAGLAITKLLISLGARKDNIILCDSTGVVYEGRKEGMNSYKSQFASKTSCRTLGEAMRGADAFLGLSVGGCVTREMVKGMAKNPIVFAMANPDPEISYEDVSAERPDAIIATGRSDFPNQVNNVLGFPFIFRGALDVRARCINEPMKLAAVRALASLAHEPVPDTVLRVYNLKELGFGKDYIIPKPFDPRVLTHVTPAVAQAAVDSGVARLETPFDATVYRDRLMALLGPTQGFMRFFINQARSFRPTLVFPEGKEERILKAVNTIHSEGIAECVLLGEEVEIREKAESLRINIDDFKIIDLISSDLYPQFARELYAMRQRKGMTLPKAMDNMKSRRYFGLMMLHHDMVDGYVGGFTRAYPDTAQPALQVIGLKEGCTAPAGLYIMFCQDRPVLFADTTLHISPTAEQLADIAIASAEMASMLGLTPKVAMLSFSNFGSNDHPDCIKMKKATEIAKSRRPDLAIDGEMQADTAVDPVIAREIFEFSPLKGQANVLVFPDLNSGNISYKLMQKLAGAEAIGPILLGMNKPVNVIHRGSTIPEIVNLAAITAVEAQRRHHS